MGKVLLAALPVLFPVPLVVVLNLQLTDADSLRLYVTLGLVAYSWWLLAVLLSLRPPWLERSVGLPAIYLVHGLLGLLALGVAYLHSRNTFAAERLAQLLGNWAFYATLALLCYAVVFLSGWLSDRSNPVRRMRSWLERVFRHQLSVWIHRLNLVVVVMIWLHVHLIDRVNQHFAFMVLFDLYTVAVLGLYVWRKWVAPDTFLAGTVEENLALNSSTRRLSVVLDRTATSSRPGDFYFLRFEHPEAGREWHPFSTTDVSRDVLTFTIRQTGDFTGKVSAIGPGTRVRLEGPFGRFDSIIDDRPQHAPLVFIGMGAGMTPLLSLTTAHLADRRIHLLWSVRRAEDAYYGALLDQHQQAGAGRLVVTTQVGRFRKEQLPEVLSRDEIEAGEFFVVGPNPAVLAMQRLLRSVGVNGRRVHQERLTL